MASMPMRASTQHAVSDAILIIIIDFVGMAIPQGDGIWGITARVGHFGIPICLRLETPAVMAR